MNEKPASEKGTPVGSVRNAVALLRTLARAEGPLGVNEAARRAGVNASTAFNVLRTLVDEGLLVFDEAGKRYRIGIGILQITRIHEARDAIEALAPDMVRIATNRECLVALWRFTQDERAVLIHKAVADSVFHLDVRLTERLPSLSGALGRAFAAAQNWPEPELHRRFSTLRWARPLPFEEYLIQVEQARTRGFGMDTDQLYEGVSTVGAVFRDHHGVPVLGISAIALSGTSAAERLEDTGAELAVLVGRVDGGMTRTAISD